MGDEERRGRWSVGGSSPKRAVGGGGGFTSGGVGVFPTVGRGHDVREGRGGARGMLAKEEQRGGRKKRGGQHRRCLSSERWATGEGGGGGSGAESAWKRETDGERGCPSAAAGTGPWPTDAGGRRACVTGTETGEGGG
jgi:hypothetical protein